MIFSGLLISSKLNWSINSIIFSGLVFVSIKILSKFSLINFGFSFEGMNNKFFSEISLIAFSFCNKFI